MPSEEMLVLDVQGLDTLVDEIKPKLHTHENEDILDEITAPFTTELLTKLDGIEDNANNYVLPVATSETLGGVKVGSGLIADGDGVLSTMPVSDLVWDEVNPSSSTTYYPILGDDTSGDGDPIHANSYTNFGIQYGTGDIAGYSQLVLGNEISYPGEFTPAICGEAVCGTTTCGVIEEGSENNAYGALQLYSSRTGSWSLTGNRDSFNDYTLMLPKTSGGLIATQDIDTKLGDGTSLLYVDEMGVLLESNSNIGSGIQSVYLENGKLTASEASVGDSTSLIYMTNGLLVPSDETVGSTGSPVYLNNGKFEECVDLSFDHVELADVAIKLGTETVGGEVNPIYLKDGSPVALSETVGSGTTLTYLNNGAITASKVTVGGATQPIFMNEGEMIATAEDVGDKATPMYLDKGKMTAISDSIGSSTLPVYLNNGTITVCNSTLAVSITGNASTATNADNADVAMKLGSATIGGTATPIYLNSGTATACSATVGSSTKPVYMASGTIAVSDATVGSGTKPIYLSSGTLTASSSTAGGTATPVYLNSGTISACSATVGSGTTPVYMSGGTIAASTSTVGSGTKPIYLSSGTLTVSSSTVGSSSVPVYLSSGTVTACTSLSLDTTGNAATADVATKLGSSTVGGAAKPIYLSSGTATACSSTVGSGVIPVYMSSGTITASTSTVGSGTKPIYLSSGTLTVSSSTVGASATPVYLSSGSITACSATVGSDNTPVYLSSGTITECAIEIGGRNLLLNSELVEETRTSTTNNYLNMRWYNSDYGNDLISNGGTFTISFDYEIDGITTACSIGPRLKYTSSAFIAPTGIANLNLSVGDNSGHYSSSFTPTEEQMKYGTAWLVNGFGAGNNGNVYIKFSHIKLEKGNMETDWIKAPEDLVGVVSIKDYFCLWYSGTETPPDDDKMTAATCGVAVCGLTVCGDTSGVLWKTEEPYTSEGLYKWVRQYTVYSDGTTEWSTPYCLTDEYNREQVEQLQSDLESGTEELQESISKVEETIQTLVPNETIGSESNPVFVNEGTITACTSLSIDTTGNAATADVATKLGTSTVGSGTKPIYLSSGTATASSSTVGSTTQPVYLSSGTVTAMSGALATTYGGTGNTSGRATYVDITETNPDSSTTYYPIWSAGINTGTNYIVRGNNGLRYNTLEGTTSEVGYGSLYLGNSTASGTATNKYGAIRIYGTGTNYWTLSGNKSITSNRTLYLPNGGGCLVVGTNGSAVGDTDVPVYINANGVATACTSLTLKSGSQLSAESSSGKIGGYIGYVSGKSSSGVATDGIGVLNVDGDYENYFIATTAGVRMQSGGMNLLIMNQNYMTLTDESGNYAALKFANSTSYNCRVGLSDSGYCGIFDATNGTYAFGWDIPNKTAYIGGAVYTSSDGNKKHGVSEMPDKCIAALDNMAPVEFKYNGGDEKMHYGYIAQEVQEAVKDAGIEEEVSIVREGEDGLYLDYNQIIAMLHLKVKQQDEKIKSLESEISAIKAAIGMD